MSTDRELLELAAKAAGIDTPYDEKWGGMLLPVTIHEPDDGYAFWNPLTDDGDALRLAVKLQIAIRPRHYYGNVDAEIDRMGYGWSEPLGQDHEAATRRAIVRAAAEVGKGMLSHDEFVRMFPGRFEAEEVERAAAEIGKHSAPSDSGREGS